MNKPELIKKIIQKKEFSQLSKRDVEIAFSHFEKRQTSDEEKIRLIRELLHKVFGAFTSQKLLSPKNKNEEWILRKHLSTRERLPYYSELYKKLLKDFNKFSIIDLGAGVNGFSYKFFVDAMPLPRPTPDPAQTFIKKILLPRSRSPAPRSPCHCLTLPLNYPEYIAIESVGQLVELMNNYFKENKISGVAYHESLFNLKKIKKIILETKKPRIIFLFKVLDSLEMLERDYSKKLLKEIAPLADKIVVSFATRSMIKRKKFKVERHWILDFIKENFKVLDDFELGGEKYICFEKKD